MSTIDQAMSFIADNLTNSYVVETGTSNGWYYKKWSDGYVDAWRLLTGTLSNYTSFASNSLHGYYFTGVKTPFTLKNVNYTVNHNWQIGSGFAIPAGLMGKTASSFNVYGVGTSSGSQSCTAHLYLHGEWE